MPPLGQYSEVTVALQGTLDTFALPDVLRLLAATKKCGRLQVRTARRSGSAWVDSGAVVRVEAAGMAAGASTADVLFDLLRSTEGLFEFEPGAAPPASGHPEDVEPLLAEAEARLAEWREIEAVVPSLDAYVALRPALPSATVSIDTEQWRLIVAIGGGATVGAVGDELRLDEVRVSRAVKELVEADLATVHGAAPDADVPAAGPVSDAVIYVPDGQEGDDDIAAQLAMLSPRAAQAIAASIDQGPTVT